MIITNKIKPKQIFPDVIFLEAPKSVDLDEIREIVGKNNQDMIFLKEGIVCKADRADVVYKVYQEAVDYLEAYQEAIDATKRLVLKNNS